jgi:hypothetical protein
MRRLVRVAARSARAAPLLAALAASAYGAPLHAQRADSQATAAPRTAASPAPAATADQRPEVRDRIASVRIDPNAIPLPPTSEITVGPRTVPAGTRIDGDVATAKGRLDVHGEVTGDAIAIDGDVVVHPGAIVGGNAFAVGGRVVGEGVVRGELRAIQGAVGAVPTGGARASAGDTSHALKLAFGWLAVLILIGLGVLVAASDYLDGVVDALEDGFSRALLVGLLGQLAILPVLLLAVVALAITVLGILLIPFAVVAYALAVAGLVTLGFLAVAQVTGRALRPVPRGAIISARGAALRALVIGVTAYLLLWIVAAAFTWSPLAGGILRAVAFAVTWVAVTAGLGAALLSRAGTRRVMAPARQAPPAEPEDLSWMTPTPVTGVVAARRPTPAATVRDPR